MPKNPHNIVANMNASNTGIAYWVRVGGNYLYTMILSNSAIKYIARFNSARNF